MATQTKYFKNEYNSEKGEFELIEIPLNRDNWFYVQLDSTVRTSFFKYGFPYPKYGIIENHSPFMIVKLFREGIKDEKELMHWYAEHLFVESELELQAKCNSNDEEDDIEDWAKIVFKIL